MSDMQNEHSQEETLAKEAISPVQPSRASARRRLLKRGVAAAPVLLTLASRPVLAWHCKSPSAWGSEQLNPHTSLATNEGHKKWADETWTISNWVSNSDRLGVGNPWAKLYAKYNGIKNNSGQFDYTKVTVAKLFGNVPGLGRPSGLSNSAYVKVVLSSGTDFQKYIIVAQLNYILLAPLASPYDLDRCVTLAELKKMASGSYSPPNVSFVWNQTDIVSYLFNNWIIQP